MSEKKTIVSGKGKYEFTTWLSPILNEPMVHLPDICKHLDLDPKHLREFYAKSAFKDKYFFDNFCTGPQAFEFLCGRRRFKSRLDRITVIDDLKANILQDLAAAYSNDTVVAKLDDIAVTTHKILNVVNDEKPAITLADIEHPSTIERHRYYAYFYELLNYAAEIYNTSFQELYYRAFNMYGHRFGINLLDMADKLRRLGIEYSFKTKTRRKDEPPWICQQEGYGESLTNFTYDIIMSGEIAKSVDLLNFEWNDSQIPPVYKTVHKPTTSMNIPVGKNYQNADKTAESKLSNQAKDALSNIDKIKTSNDPISQELQRMI